MWTEIQDKNNAWVLVSTYWDVVKSLCFQSDRRGYILLIGVLCLSFIILIGQAVTHLPHFMQSAWR